MKKQKFKPGDRVRRRKSFYTGLIVEAQYRPALNAIALVRGEEVASSSPERWVFKIDGEGFNSHYWFHEEVLESSQPCPIPATWLGLGYRLWYLWFIAGRCGVVWVLYPFGFV